MRKGRCFGRLDKSSRDLAVPVLQPRLLLYLHKSWRRDKKALRPPELARIGLSLRPALALTRVSKADEAGRGGTVGKRNKRSGTLVVLS